MRALFVAKADPGGSLYYLTRHLRAHAGIDARLITLTPPGVFAWPTDVGDLFDGGQELRHLLQAADVLHMVDLVPTAEHPLQEAIAARLAGPRPPKLVLQWDDPIAKTAHVGMHAIDGAARLATRPGLAQAYRARLVPPFVPTWMGPWSPQPLGTRLRQRLTHAEIVVTSRRPLAQSRKLEALVDDVEAASLPHRRFKMVVLVGKPHREVLQRRRRAHVALCVSRDGLSRTALESLAVGAVTVMEAPAFDAHRYADFAGKAPPPLVQRANVGDVLAQLFPQHEPQAEAVAWARRALAPEHWVRACRVSYGLE